MTEPQVQTGDQGAPRRQDTHPIIFVLDRLRSAHNVGNIFRLAEICRIEKIITCGYTATPPHPKLAKTARGCDELVACETAPDAATAAKNLRNDGYFVLGVETVEGAPDIWSVRMQFPLAIVLGNEALGIGAETLKECSGFARLPVYGVKNSMNVGNCAAIAVYEAMRRLESQ